MTIENPLVRAANILGSYGNYRTTPERIDKETVALASCEVVNQELDLFIRYVYRRADNGRWLHIQANGQIPKGVWTPWGSSGKSSLTRYERDTTRRYMDSMYTSRPPYPLFYYGQEDRHWHVHTRWYPLLDDALAWLNKHKLTPSIWFEYAA